MGTSQPDTGLNTVPRMVDSPPPNCQQGHLGSPLEGDKGKGQCVAGGWPRVKNPKNALLHAWGGQDSSFFWGVVSYSIGIPGNLRECFVLPTRSTAITAASTYSFLGMDFSGSVTKVVLWEAKRSDKALQAPMGKTPGLETESTKI